LLVHAPRREPIRVVEVGCGEGLMAAAFASFDAGVDYTGADISASAVALARDAVPGVQFSVIDAGDGSDVAPAASADLVVAKNLLHHVTDPEALLAAMGRALDRGGRVAVVEPTRSSAQAMFFSVLAPRREKYFFRRGRREIRNAIDSAGLRLVAHEAFSFLPYELAFALRFSAPRRLLRTGAAPVARIDDALASALPWIASYQLFVAERR
jgi:SAM-dependent methyltransferase